MGTVRCIAAGMAVAVLATACGAGGGRDAAKPIPATQATALAARAEQVGADYAGGACDKALAEARSLQSDIAALPIDPAARDQAVAGAARLVGSIICTPPTTITTVPTVVVDPGPGKKHKGGHGHDDD